MKMCGKQFVAHNTDPLGDGCMAAAMCMAGVKAKSNCRALGFLYQTRQQLRAAHGFEAIQIFKGNLHPQPLRFKPRFMEIVCRYRQNGIDSVLGNLIVEEVRIPHMPAPAVGFIILTRMNDKNRRCLLYTSRCV